ncbi:MAG TPA: hypothetical protein VFS76_16550 [Pyrinomonadaceae bacterium]|nr:hypothetical protein [Pyrinomonadaceae bacterium]
MDSTTTTTKPICTNNHFGAGAVGPLARHTHRNYLNSSNYINNDVHILDRLTQISTIDPSGVERARTNFEYDVYSGSNHAALKDWSTVVGLPMAGHDSSFGVSYATRGNVTATTHYLLSHNEVVGSVVNYVQYDLAGHPVKMIDGLGHSMTFNYTDCFGGGNGEARTNAAPAELSAPTPRASYAFPTLVTNHLGHTTYSQFDYNLGLTVDREDQNQIVSSTDYDDMLDRPTQIRNAVGTTASTQTSFVYDDVGRTITASRDLHNFNDNFIVQQVLYDGLGRTTESRQFEGASHFIATRTEYDALGRPFNTSNPFRPWQPNQSIVWTTQAFDGLGRVISITTPDNAVVSTVYSGNTVKVTDPAGRSRKSVTDALGRLIDVYEDPEVPGGPAELNYQTTYTYDILDNLVKVTQGSQQRFFLYDSLKRLIRARNPEQGTNANLGLADSLTGNSVWSMGYQYDSNSNLTHRTDALGVVSTYVYDALNRNTTVDYSNTPINPDVSRLYDGATKGKGKLWYSYAGGDESLGNNVEKTVLESYDPLGRPLVLRQFFKHNGTWNTGYEVSRSYNRAGGVSEQFYPSTHSVTYNYDAAGRLADKNSQDLAFTGNLGDGVTRTYSRGISYASGGQLTQEQFGTTASVYNKLFYNWRQQLAEILVSTTTGNTWDRGKILNQYSLQCSGASCNATDNNGNLRKQEVFIPNIDPQLSPTSWYQQYDYDELNRLNRVHEYTNVAGLDWQQEYLYDRWGNRRIDDDVNKTFGTGINNKKFEIEAATNRLYADGDLALADSQRKIRYDAAGNKSKISIPDTAMRRSMPKVASFRLVTKTEVLPITRITPMGSVRGEK